MEKSNTCNVMCFILVLLLILINTKQGDSFINRLGKFASKGKIQKGGMDGADYVNLVRVLCLALVIALFAPIPLIGGYGNFPMIAANYNYDHPYRKYFSFGSQGINEIVQGIYTDHQIAPHVPLNVLFGFGWRLIIGALVLFSINFSVGEGSDGIVTATFGRFGKLITGFSISMITFIALPFVNTLLSIVYKKMKNDHAKECKALTGKARKDKDANYPSCTNNKKCAFNSYSKQCKESHVVGFSFGPKVGINADEILNELKLQGKICNRINVNKIVSKALGALELQRGDPRLDIFPIIGIITSFTYPLFISVMKLKGQAEQSVEELQDDIINITNDCKAIGKDIVDDFKPYFEGDLQHDSYFTPLEYMKEAETSYMSGGSTEDRVKDAWNKIKGTGTKLEFDTFIKNFNLNRNVSKICEKTTEAKCKAPNCKWMAKSKMCGPHPNAAPDKKYQEIINSFNVCKADGQHYHMNATFDNIIEGKTCDVQDADERKCVGSGEIKTCSERKDYCKDKNENDCKGADHAKNCNWANKKCNKKANVCDKKKGAECTGLKGCELKGTDSCGAKCKWTKEKGDKEKICRIKDEKTVKANCAQKTRHFQCTHEPKCTVV